MQRFLAECPACESFWERGKKNPPLLEVDECPECGIGFDPFATQYESAMVLTHVLRVGENWLTDRACLLLSGLKHENLHRHPEEACRVIEQNFRHLISMVNVPWPDGLAIEAVQVTDDRLDRAWDRRRDDHVTERSDILRRIVNQHRHEGVASIIVPVFRGDVCAMTCIGALLLGWTPSASQS